MRGWRLRLDLRGGQPFGNQYFLILSPSVLNISLVPRCSRICLVVRLIMPWRLPDWANITFPVPVILKRVLALDLVLILGIWLSCSGDATTRPVSIGNAQKRARCPRAWLFRACWLSTSPPPRQPFSRAAGGRGLWQSDRQMATHDV